MHDANHTHLNMQHTPREAPGLGGTFLELTHLTTRCDHRLSTALCRHRHDYPSQRWIKHRSGALSASYFSAASTEPIASPGSLQCGQHAVADQAPAGAGHGPAKETYTALTWVLPPPEGGERSLTLQHKLPVWDPNALGPLDRLATGPLTCYRG